MPRYFFHIEDGSTTHDEEGTVLENVTVAKGEAVKLAGQMICDSAGSFWDRQEWKLTAANAEGLTLFCLHFVGIDAPAAMGARDPNLIAARVVEASEEPAGEAAPRVDGAPPEAAA
ncbi:MAG TPA: hypothetical protein VD846_08670 [Allosphingosinicella sp.]|nr:hypothetical protein [Allosphingosinicella sp.]